MKQVPLITDVIAALVSLFSLSLEVSKAKNNMQTCHVSNKRKIILP